MARIIVNNPRQVINGGAKKYYFKVKGLGGPKGDKGDKGDTGSQGPQGPQGNAATISVGSTTTLPVGYNATVENVGSIYNAVLNFGIPQGPRGPQGATGAKGDKGDKGEQGNPGPQGEKGTNATVTVGTTTTTEPGTQAYAWNSSSNPNNAVINFNIPRGATGSQGPQGVQGPTGPAGADGESFTPVVVSSLPPTGTEGKLYLTPKAHTTQTATGNPITATVSEDAGKIESFQLDGDTLQQSYEGKNLWGGFASDFSKTSQGVSYTNKADGVIFANGTASGNSLSFISSEAVSNGRIITLQAGDYAISGGTSTVTLQVVSSDGAEIAETDSYGVKAFTLPEATDIFVRARVARGTVADNVTIYPQLEAGSATSYEPYVGGQPSPNPDYPQPIQTVTGLQTITINGTDYPLDLGSIELCKLGTYQDYIYKDGDDWKVHKAIDKHIFDGSESFSLDDTYEGIYQFRWSDTSVIRTSDQNTIFVLSDRFRGVAFDASWTKDFTVTVMANRDNPLRFMTSLSSTAEAFKTWLASNQTTTYFVLKTPTDTVITDTTLISQLEAIRTASLQNGANTITNTATGSNLAGDMEIGYYGFNPRNRYDKWLWLDINNEFEQIGS